MSISFFSKFVDVKREELGYLRFRCVYGWEASTLANKVDDFIIFCINQS